MASVSRSETPPSFLTRFPFMRRMLRLMAWWHGEIASLSRELFQGRKAAAEDVLLLTLDGSRGILERLTPQGREELLHIEPATDTATVPPEMRQKAQEAAAGCRVLVKVPEKQVVWRRLTLPAPLEENLRQSLIYELDRYTPFQPEQAYFDFKVLTRDPAQGEMTIELAAVHKSLIARAMGLGSLLGLNPVGATLIDDSNGNPIQLDFLPSPVKQGGDAARLSWRNGLPWLAVTLFTGWLLVPVWQKHVFADALRNALTDAATAAEEVENLQNRVEEAARGYNLMMNLKWSRPTVLEVLEELSQRLPDDTFVIQLDFDGKSIQVQGESASASTLVEKLEDSPLFKDVGFRAQLIKIPGTARDRFHISATLETLRRP